jgi:hypothetical protein
LLQCVNIELIELERRNAWRNGQSGGFIVGGRRATSERTPGHDRGTQLNKLAP